MESSIALSMIASKLAYPNYKLFASIWLYLILTSLSLYFSIIAFEQTEEASIEVKLL